MQAILILSFIVFYLLDQYVGGNVVQGAGWRIAAVPFLILVGPAAIALQANWLSRPSVDSPDNRRRLAQLSIGIWFLSGLLLIVGLNWGSVLRHQLQLEDWSPLAEVILFVPLTLSLFGCWAVQFQLERRGSAWNQDGLHSFLCDCREYVTIRANVFLVPAFIPWGTVILTQSLGQWLVRFTGSSVLAAWLNLGCLLLGLALLPWILATFWRARPIPVGSLRDAVVSTVRAQRVRFRDIRVWPTGNQLSNALVIGIFPKLRMLILTDRLVRLLNRDELCAVVAHEAGHVRHAHLPIRIWYLLQPLVAYSVIAILFRCVSNKQGVPNGVAGFQNEPWAVMIAAAVYTTYSCAVMAWISRNMEFQADLSACRLADVNQPMALDGAATRNFCEAILKLAADSGENVKRSGWLHPSVARRVQFACSAIARPAIAQAFERTFARKKILLTALIWAVAIAVQLRD